MAAPSTPTNVFIQQGNGQVLLNWDAMSGATSYPIQRSTDGINFTSLYAPTVNQYLDSSVTAGTTYYYQIAASNGTVSAYSSTVSIVPTIAGQLSLGELRLAAQQRADRVNSNFVTTAEWNQYINQSYFELYDLLVQKFGNDYFVAPWTQFTTTGAQSYTLPDGVTNFQNQSGSNFVPPPFYKLLGVDLALSAGNNAWITLKKYEFISRNRFVYPQITTSLLGVAGLRYRLVGSQLEFIPTPAANQVVRLWYIPRMTQLLLDSDVCDGVSGWTEYIIVDAAIKALQKQECDVSVLMAQKQALIQRIESAAENRDAGEPETISNTRRATDLWGGGFPGDEPTGGF